MGQKIYTMQCKITFEYLVDLCVYSMYFSGVKSYIPKRQVVANWGFTVFRGPADAVSYSDNEGYRSTSCIKFEHQNNTDWSNVHQNLRGAIVPNKQYRVSYKYKTNSSAGIHCVFGDYPACISRSVDVGTIQHPIADNKWHTYSSPSFSLPASEVKDKPVFAFIYDYNSIGTVWIDDVVLEESGNTGAASSSNILKNGDFESVTEGRCRGLYWNNFAGVKRKGDKFTITKNIEFTKTEKGWVGPDGRVY